MRWSFLWIFLAISPLIGAEKILVISIMNSKSVKNFYSPLYIELAQRGHDLTIISPFKTSDHPKIRDIVGRDLLTGNKDSGDTSNKNYLDDKNVFTQRKEGKSTLPISMTNFLVDLCREYYSMPEIQDLMAHEKFDIILAFYTFNECGFGMVHHFQTPFILLHSNVIIPWNNPTGLPLPYSHVPLPYFPTSDKMSFYERVRNLVVGNVYGLVDNWYRIPKMEAVYREFLPDAPSSDEIARNQNLCQRKFKNL
ncbi:unnamed protein product [Allacma fusca]|uniref:Uncharacterized protein n=1 Tax=Allacma fusca TaxID=39272 RepID=A0A8J2JZZ1_9HEXA|nr:unnamed protein product [Allacma fusca]